MKKLPKWEVFQKHMAEGQRFTPLVCRADCIGHSHSGVWLASQMLAHVLISLQDLVLKKALS